MRFNNTNFRSLNESINEVQNPQWALDEALEYADTLEEVILSICEELETDPDELVEMAMTVARERELSKAIKAQGRKTQAAYDRDEKEILSGKRGPVSSSRDFKKQYKKSQALGARYSKEGTSHKVYGKGGKVLKRVKTTHRKDPRSVRGRGYGGIYGGWSDQD